MTASVLYPIFCLSIWGNAFAFTSGGGVSRFFAFRASRCRLASVRYLVSVWGFTSIPFSCRRSTISLC